MDELFTIGSITCFQKTDRDNFYFMLTLGSDRFASTIKLMGTVSRSCVFHHRKLSKYPFTPCLSLSLPCLSLAFDCPVGYQQLLNTAQLQNRRECLNNSCSLESQSGVDNASQKVSKHEAPVAHFNIMNSAKIYYIPLQDMLEMEGIFSTNKM